MILQVSEHMFSQYYPSFPADWEYRSNLIKGEWTLAVLIEILAPFFFLKMYRHFFIFSSITTLTISIGYPYVSPESLEDAP